VLAHSLGRLTFPLVILLLAFGIRHLSLALCQIKLQRNNNSMATRGWSKGNAYLLRRALTNGGEYMANMADSSQI